MRSYLGPARVRQQHVLVYWEEIKDNLDDFFTRNSPTKYHRAIKGTYLFPISDSIKHASYQLPSNL